MTSLLAFLLPFAFALESSAAPSAASPAAPPSNVVILPPRPGDPPDPVELAAAERLVERMIPPGTLPLVLATRIEAMAPHPDFPPRSAGPAEWEARRREIARREARDPSGLRRARIAATVRREELGAAFARAEPAVRSALARYYEQTLPLSDIEAAARFFATPEGIRFLTATLTLPGSPAYRQAAAVIEPELAAAEARIASRIATATAR